MPDLPWRVAYVRSRQEKELARLLLRQDVPFYLPLQEKQAQRAGRRFVSFLPLFPGYLFFRGPRVPPEPATARPPVRWDELVVSVLEVPDQPRLAGELRTLWRLQESGAALVACPYVGPGDAVEVIDGPFRGLSGTVLRAKGRSRLIVSVSLLRQSVAAELGREVLAPARPARQRPAPEARPRRDVRSRF